MGVLANFKLVTTLFAKKKNSTLLSSMHILGTECHNEHFLHCASFNKFVVAIVIFFLPFLTLNIYAGIKSDLYTTIKVLGYFVFNHIFTFAIEFYPFTYFHITI